MVISGVAHGTVYCPFCGAPVPEGSTTCSGCGAAVLIVRRQTHGQPKKSTAAR